MRRRHAEYFGVSPSRRASPPSGSRAARCVTTSRLPSGTTSAPRSTGRRSTTRSSGWRWPSSSSSSGYRAMSSRRSAASTALLERAADLPPELEARALRVYGGVTAVSGDQAGSRALSKRSLVDLRRARRRVRHCQSPSPAGRLERDRGRRRGRAAGAGGEPPSCAGDGQQDARDRGRQHAGKRRVRTRQPRCGDRASHAAGRRAVGRARDPLVPRDRAGRISPSGSCEAGNLEAAETAGRRAIEVAREIDDARLGASALAALAVVARRRGDARRAGKLLGRSRGRAGTRSDGLERRRHGAAWRAGGRGRRRGVRGGPRPRAASSRSIRCLRRRSRYGDAT